MAAGGCSGVAFAMVRASYGRDSEDPRFKANRRWLQAVALRRLPLLLCDVG